MQNKIILQSFGTALVISILLTGCAEQRSQPDSQISTSNPVTSNINSQTENKTYTSNPIENQSEDSSVLSKSSDEQSSSDESNTSESSVDIDTVSINSDVIWGMGKTFDELTEKYGNVTSGNFNTYSFENGYGIYVWDTNGGADYSEVDREKNISLVRESGGCIMIDGIRAKDFLNGNFSTLKYEDFTSNCGFEVISLNSNNDPNTMYDDYRFAYYTHPSYENMTFIMCYKDGVIDEFATFTIRSDDL